MNKQPKESSEPTEIPSRLADARNVDWSTVKFSTPLLANIVESLASAFGVKYYARHSKEQNLQELLALDQQTVERVGMHRLPPTVLEAVKETIRLEAVEESIAQQEKPISEEQFDKAVGKTFEILSKVPRWFSLNNKESAILILDEGERFLVHQIDGSDGFFVYSHCPAGDPDLRSCAIPLVLSTMSKLLNVNVVSENVVLQKPTFLRFMKSLNLTLTNIDNHMPWILFEKFLMNGKPFKNVDMVFIARTETDLQSFDSGEIIMKNNSLRCAGEAFMFNIVFGVSSNPTSFKVKQVAQRVTKVMIDPMTSSIKKLLDLANMSYDDVIKNQAEQSFLKTKTILDDAQFIEGMNDVRNRILYNKSTLSDTISISLMEPRDKQTLYDNLQLLQNVTIIDFMIRLSQRSAGSPWRPSK